MNTKSDKDNLLELLSDGRPHSTREICAEVYGGEQFRMARIPSRINDLVNEGHTFLNEFGYEIPRKSKDGKPVKRCWKEKGTSIHWYWLKVTFENSSVMSEREIKWRAEQINPVPTQAHLI